MINKANFEEVTKKGSGKLIPLLTVHETLIAFGAGTIRQLNSPKYVKILIDKKDKLACLFAADQNEENAFRFAKDSNVNYVHLFSKNIHSLFNDLTGFIDITYPYSVIGEIDHFEDGQICVIFDFKTAQKKK